MFVEDFSHKYEFFIIPNDESLLHRIKSIMQFCTLYYIEVINFLQILDMCSFEFI